VLLDRIAETVGDLVDRPLEARITERLDLPAVAADKVVVMVAVGLGRLIARDAVAGIDALHEPQVGQGLEGAIDGCDSDRAPRPAERVEDLLRAHAAVLAAEQLDDRMPCSAPAVAGLGQGIERVTSPPHIPHCIVPSMISRIVLILLVAVAAVGCGARSSAAPNRTSVVAAFYPLAYAAERIDGKDVQVKNLTPPGAEPHDFELAPRSVADLQRAEVILYLGHGFQPAVSAAVKDARGTVVDLLAGLPLRPNTSGEEGLSADPHVWLDPILFGRMVERIATILHAPGRDEALLADLRRLDRAYRTGLAHCARREIVTSHAAFGYLAQRYDLTEVAITGLEPEAEPSAKDLAEVVKVLRRTHATTVFFETLVSPRLAKTVAREVGARTAVLNPIEGLTPAEQARGANYLSVMKQNLATLRRALGCR
jgi:zinc transport system substrate-binding protein